MFYWPLAVILTKEEFKNYLKLDVTWKCPRISGIEIFYMVNFTLSMQRNLKVWLQRQSFVLFKYRIQMICLKLETDLSYLIQYLCFSGGKTAQRNVEITMCVVTDKGRIINVS